MTGIDELHRELLAKNYKYARPGITGEPWAREMQLVDPFGNTLRFAERPS